MIAALNTLKTIELVRVQAQGFRGFKDSVEIDFATGKNEFIGDNGKGKSSIGELIAWIITGRNIAGKQKEINITNKDCQFVIGILTFKDQNGNIHELERKQTSSMTIKFDYENISQRRLEELIPMDLFLCAFNPIYFLSLDKDVSRKTIASLFPTLTKAGILAEMDATNREHLEKESFEVDQTNQYLKNRNEELKQLEDNRKWLEGYIGKLKEKVVIPEQRTFNDASLTSLHKQLEDLLSRKPELKDIKDMLKKRGDLQGKLAQIQHENFGHQMEKSDLMKKKALLEQELSVELAKQYTPINFTGIETKLEVMRTDYKHNLEAARLLDQESRKLDAKKVHVQEGDDCPYCKQSISKESVEILAKELAMEVAKDKQELEGKQQEKKKTLAELEVEGKNLLAEIAKAKETDEQNRQQFEVGKKNAIDTINGRLKLIEEELLVISKQEKEFEEMKKKNIQALQVQIQQLGVDKMEEENIRIQREFDAVVSTEKAKLQAEIQRLQKEKEEVLAYESNRHSLLKRVEDQRKDLENRQKEMDGYGVKEVEIRNKIYYMKSFNAKKIELLNETIKKQLKDVEIRLQKTIESTGELKDCFEILYRGKELKICSTSETIRAGLEISNMVSTLSGVKFPVFVDNGESITTYDDPGFQTIEVRVAKDKPLTMIRGSKELEIKSSYKKVVSSKPRSSSGYTRSSVGTGTSTEAAG
ncbi:hypothetical protein ACFVS2_20490 [Brevibacillus sp. NPDC058079]|uniref:AAA family ATPase n=1 Tax=Brevibacillus sp. NPDC058079 TaxID=3346330 RepID=UPI0036E5D80C